MDVSLSRIWSRVLLVAAALLYAGALSTVAVRVAVAAHWAGSPDPANWSRAAHLESGDADWWRQLGLYEEFDFEHGDLDRSISYFQKATRLDPHSDALWMDFAAAYETAGQIDRAGQAYEQALSLHPNSADVAWRYGTFLLRRAKTREAAREVRRALIDEPQLAASAVAQFAKSGASLDLILGQVVPARLEDYLAVINFFVSERQDNSALATWQKLAALGQHFPLADSLGLINALIASNRPDDAMGVWRQALAASGLPAAADPGGSLVFNGGFETDLVNGGFGWRETSAIGTAFDLVTDVVHTGRRSARVSFEGDSNVNFDNLMQYVAVVPGRRYRFSAYMRTDDVSTDSGPQFLLEDPAHSWQPVAQTPVMTGTHPWTEVRAEFTAGSDSRCVVVALRRLVSHMFDNKIRGTVWIDDVRLVEARQGEESAR